jgi:hypothetical protein
VIPPPLLEVIHHPLPQGERHDHRPLVEQAIHATGDPELRMYLGRDLLDEGENAAAAAEFEQLLADSRATLELRVRAGRRLAEARWRLGDRTAARWALADAKRHLIVARQTRTPIQRIQDDLDTAYPITDDHPVWALEDEFGVLHEAPDDGQLMRTSARHARANGAERIWVEALAEAGVPALAISAALHDTK